MIHKMGKNIKKKCMKHSLSLYTTNMLALTYSEISFLKGGPKQKIIK